MNIDLIEPVQAVLEEVRSVTGKDLEFIARDELPAYARIKMARKDMPSHLVYYRKKHDEIINHLIVHECGHILRTFRCPEDRRLVPFSDRQTMRAALSQIEGEITAVAGSIPGDQLASAVGFWYSGIILQLTNLPPDIMIEKWIHDRFPSLRPIQLKSLQRQHAEAVAVLGEAATSMTPRTILFASNVMNYAFFRVLGLHIGRNFVREYNQTPYLGRGKELAAMTGRDYADSHEGDNLMIDRWAKFLNMTGWFQWRDFEDLPPDYEQH